MTARSIVAWLLPLNGHAFDLQDLPMYLAGSPVTVVKHQHQYCLQLSVQAVGADCKGVRDQAKDFLAMINGAASLLIDGYEPVEIAEGGLRGLDSNGQVANTVLEVQSGRFRIKGGHVTLSVNGVSQPDDRFGRLTSILNGVKNNHAKADALALIGRPAPTWSELYLVFELVEANVGGRMYSDRWITRSDARTFTRTANSYTALGRHSRHGKDRGDPPSDPMSHKVATDLMRALVGSWIRNTSSAAAAT